MNNFVAHTEAERQEMLKNIGLSSIEDLYKDIPSQIRLKGLNLPDELSELELTRELKKLAASNKTDYAYFLGGGAAKRFIPAAVSHSISLLAHFKPDNLNKSYSIGASAVIVVVSSKVT